MKVVIILCVFFWQRFYCIQILSGGRNFGWFLTRGFTIYKPWLKAQSLPLHDDLNTAINTHSAFYPTNKLFPTKKKCWFYLNKAHWVQPFSPHLNDFSHKMLKQDLARMLFYVSVQYQQVCIQVAVMFFLHFLETSYLPSIFFVKRLKPNCLFSAYYNRMLHNFFVHWHQLISGKFKLCSMFLHVMNTIF